MANFPWGDETIAMLQRGSVERMTGSQIAAWIADVTGLPCSRNAVIGKMSRLGLPLKGACQTVRSTPVVEKSKPAPRVVRVTRPAPAPERITPMQVLTPAPMPAIIAPLPAAPELVAIPRTKRITLFDLRNDTCRWPVNNGSPWLFCGAPGANFTNKRPYCAEHSAIARDRVRSKEEIAAFKERAALMRDAKAKKAGAR